MKTFSCQNISKTPRNEVATINSWTYNHCLRTLFFFIALAIALSTFAQNKKADELAQAVQRAIAEGNRAEAIRLNDEEIAARRNDKGFMRLFLGNSLQTQAVNYAVMHDYNKAVELEREAMEIFRDVDKEKLHLGISLNNLAAYHYSRGLSGDYAEAERCAEEALKYEKSSTEHYINTANLLVIYHTMAGHPDKASALGKRLFKQGRKIFGTNTVEYAEILSNQSVTLAKIGNYNEAIEYAEESASIYQEQGDTVSIVFAKLLMNTANYYAAGKEDYHTCIDILERARNILRTVEGERGLTYINCTGELSSAYNHIGDLQKADDLAHSTRISMSSNDNRDDVTTVAKAIPLKKQAEVFANNGNYNVAINIQSNVLDIYTQHGDSLGMADAYNTLSNYYYHNNKLDKAIECSNASIGLYSRNRGRKTDMAQAYNSMSIYCYHNKEYDNALQYATNAVSLYKAEGDSTSSFYAKALTNMALYHYAVGNLDGAIEYAIHSYNLQKNVLGEEHPDNVTNLFNIAQYYYAKGDDQKLYEYYHKALEMQSGFVRSNFSHMTTVGRELYWNTKKHIYTIAPTYAFLKEDNDSILIDAYNSQLLTKGILLNSEIDFKSLLTRSGDSILLGKYLQLADLNKQIEEIYSNAASSVDQTTSYTNDVRNLRRRADILERELMRDSKEYGDYTSNMTISVDNISAALKDEDVAVELFEIPVSGGGKAYYAMYLKRGWKVPRLIKLFTHIDLKVLEHDGKDFYQLLSDRNGINHIFSTGTAGQIVWNPLIQDWGEGVKNVYFSPSGLFYQWGIEYLQLNDGERIGDKYNIYRLSSTKLLAQTQEESAIKEATIFGGLDYDIEPTLMAEQHDKAGNYLNELVTPYDSNNIAEQSAAFDLAEATIDSLSMRGSENFFGFLDGTLVEAKAINEMLTQSGVKTHLLTHEKGVEENFKALNGKGHSLIHIATHGFSIGEAHEDRQSFASLLGEAWSASANDANLNFSGLVLSGGNNVLFGEKLPRGIENGILTSREISMIDLRGLELVVMSACQTGLGDIKEDGVFGLQRGFKKAGAKTLLMSLWSVDDRATQIMMTSFYSSLMQGVSRHNAFKQAQNSVKAAGFTAPFYWASFIMLDDM